MRAKRWLLIVPSSIKDKAARWTLPKFPHERLSHLSRELGKNMRWFVIIRLLAWVLFGAVAGVFAQEVQPPKTEEDNGYSQIAIFAKALELIRQDYVDENKTSYHDLVTAAMK